MTRSFILLNLAIGLLLAFLLRRQSDSTDTNALGPPASAVAPQYQPNVARPVRAAFVILVRNSELLGMKRAMRQIEDRFNSKFNYPYVFLNDVPFTEEFKVETAAMTKANVTFGVIPHEHWSYPAWINQTFASECRQNLSKQGVFYALSESYRHMCRFNSGFFFRHPLLQEIDYYWRIEPDVEYSCDIDYDPFLYMHSNGIKYGYTIALHEYPETIPTLWATVKDFIASHPSFVRHENGVKWLSYDGGKSYNGCHFWSNFEIGALSLFRSPEYLAFFEHLDRAGGFFYERWGDAPVHSIAAALLLKKEELHWFKDIGYYHNPWHNCPLDKESRLRCHCDPAKSAVHHYWASCTKEWVDLPDGNNTQENAISSDVTIADI
ncbi:alpha-1,2-mannosyltransferase ktr1 [Coemansia erecta]|nr:alpha-1,2-mannosyltransferase ktr1 [Coemansia erecta]